MSNEDPYAESIRSRILKSLEDGRYKARTIRGIAKEANISESVAMSYIKGDKKISAKVMKYPRKNKEGSVLYVTIAKFKKEASWKERFIDAFSDGDGI